MDNLRQTFTDASSLLSKAVKDTNLQDEASVVFNRAKQYTEEKLGKAERTQLDPHLVVLETKTDNMKNLTEKMKNNSAAVLVPNPAARAESLFFDSVPVDKIGIKNERMSNLEYLGSDMIEAGNEFGTTSPYGAALIRVGQTEKKLGLLEKEYIRAGNEGMVSPLTRFLEGEMKNIMRERKILENKRLDLDACKNRVRKARGMLDQPPKDGIDPRQVLEQAETELRLSQSEFDRQAEITKLLMEGLSQSQTNHVRHLKSFVAAQVEYYAQAHLVMQDLNRELNSDTLVGSDLVRPTLMGQQTNGLENTQEELSNISLASPSFPKNAQVF